MKKLSIALGVFLLVGGCATTNAPNSAPAALTTNESAALAPLGPDNAYNSTGTLSPLNTSANPWTNVNPQVQEQMRQGKVNGR